MHGAIEADGVHAGGVAGSFSKIRFSERKGTFAVYLSRPRVSNERPTSKHVQRVAEWSQMRWFSFKDPQTQIQHLDTVQAFPRRCLSLAARLSRRAM